MLQFIIKSLDTISNKLKTISNSNTDTEIDTLSSQDKVDTKLPSGDLLKYLHNDTFDETKPTLLLLDDKPIAIESLLDDLDELGYIHNLNIIDKFNILKFTGASAAFKLNEVLKSNPDIKIDYAIVDILLNGIQIVDGKSSRLDGVDVIKILTDKYSTLKFKFHTGCVITSNVNDPLNFYSKFKTIFDCSINDFIFPKDTNGNYDAYLDNLYLFLECERFQ